MKASVRHVRRHPPPAITLGGLLKHLALIEDWTTAAKLTGQPLGVPFETVDFDADPDWEWRTGAEDSPDELYALWNGAVARSRAAWARVLADGGLDQPSTHRTGTGKHPSLRRVLVDLHDEYAGHVGHADLLREAVDGRVGEDPPQPCGSCSTPGSPRLSTHPPAGGHARHPRP